MQTYELFGFAEIEFSATIEAESEEDAIQKIEEEKFDVLLPLKTSYGKFEFEKTKTEIFSIEEFSDG